MAELKLILEINWEQSEEVCNCSACNDLIVSGSNHLFVGDMLTDCVLCNSCYEILKEIEDV